MWRYPRSEELRKYGMVRMSMIARITQNVLCVFVHASSHAAEKAGRDNSKFESRPRLTELARARRSRIQVAHEIMRQESDSDWDSDSEAALALTVGSAGMNLKDAAAAALTARQQLCHDG